MNVQMLVLFAVGVTAVAALGWLAVRRSRSERLPSPGDAEQERSIEGRPDLTEAVADPFQIRPLGRIAHHRFSEEWASVQAMFVEDPSGAVEQAHGLADDVMRARGYPVGDFEERAAELAVDHPTVVENYPEAQALAQASRDGSGDPDVVHRAFVRYRALFADLLERAPALEVRPSTEPPLTRTSRAS
jgi:hypothetical protein